ncbi:MAG: FecR family protein [Opitutaceae bacterium]
MSPRQSASRPDQAAPDALAEIAVAWLYRREAGLDPSAAAELDAWLAADPRHAATFASLEPSWSALNRPRCTGQGADLRRHVETIVARRRRGRVLYFTTGIGLAAALVIGFFFMDRMPVAVAVAAPSIAVKPDQRALPDGSTVELNRDAELAIDFSTNTRAVRLLRGEALFHVAKDPARPFVVSAGRVAVRAVGTAFSVRLDPEAVDILVTEGRVAVTQPALPLPSSAALFAADPGSPPSPSPFASEPIIATAGNRLVVPAQSHATSAPTPQIVTTSQTATALAWRQRRLEFDGTPLADAVQIFNRDSSLQLLLANAKTGALRITGVFWTTDPAAFSRALEIAHDLTATAQPGGHILLRK